MGRSAARHFVTLCLKGERSPRWNLRSKKTGMASKLVVSVSLLFSSTLSLVSMYADPSVVSLRRMKVLLYIGVTSDCRMANIELRRGLVVFLF